MAGAAGEEATSAKESITEEKLIEAIPSKLERALRQSLAPNERVLVKLRGAFSEALICTDTRVLILKSGWMTGQIFGVGTFQVPYVAVAGAEVNFHLVTGYFEISAGGMQSTPKSFWQLGTKQTAAKASNCVSISGSPQAQNFRQASSLIMQMVAQSRLSSVR